MSLFKIYFIILFPFLRSILAILTNQQWKYIEKCLQHPELTPELRNEIDRSIFYHHIPLAKKRCNDFTTFHKYKTKFVQKDDLHFHSISGLYHAVRKYNGRNNFVKFAKIYIDGSLYKGLTKHYPITQITAKERSKHKGETSFKNFDSIRDKTTNLYLGTNQWHPLKSTMNYLPYNFPVERYMQKWDIIHNMSPFLCELFHLKFDFEFNVIESNKNLGVYYCCSEETIRKNVKKTIITLTSANI